MRGARCRSTSLLASRFIDSQIYYIAVLNCRTYATIYSARNNALSSLWAGVRTELNIIHNKLNFALDVAVRQCNLASHGTEMHCTMFSATVSVAILPTHCLFTAYTLLIPRGIMRAMTGSTQTEPCSVEFSRDTAVAVCAHHAHASFNSTSQNAVQANSYGVVIDQSERVSNVDHDHETEMRFITHSYYGQMNLQD
jgi:hypothetical protein